MLITFKCSQCGKVNVVEVNDEIDLTGNQDLLKKVLDTTHFNHKCEDCGKEHNVIYDVLLQDNNEKFYIKINSQKQLLTLMSQDDFKIRIVNNLNEANEKLRCFYYRLDDRIVEIIKHLIKEDLERNNPGLEITEMYFYRYLDSNLEFLIFSPDQFLGSMKYSSLGYKDLLIKHKKSFDNTLQVVDSNFAKSFLSEQMNNNKCA